MHATFGAADPAQRFAPIAAAMGWTDPCGEKGPVGRWVKMSASGAPVSLHDQSWVESAALWTGTRLVVALRRDGQWNGSAFDPCHNVWSPIRAAPQLAASEPWLSDDHDRPYQPAGTDGPSHAFERVSIWDPARKDWLTVKSDRPPARRAHYAVALAGPRLLVWGGWAPTLGVLGDGAVLEVPRKSWKKMSTAGAPSPRLEPTAVAW